MPKTISAQNKNIIVVKVQQMYLSNSSYLIYSAVIQRNLVWVYKNIRPLQI